MRKSNWTDKIQQTLHLLTCLLILASLAIIKQGKLFGHDFKNAPADATILQPSKSTTLDHTATTADTLRTLADGTIIVNTTHLASDISGYAGQVPLEISIKDNVVTDIKALDNEESKPFFDKASALLNAWRGKSLNEAKSMKVDAVSGATFSSKAIIGNVRRGLQYMESKEQEQASTDTDSDTSCNLDLKNIVGLAVALMAAIMPLFAKSRKWRMTQTLLNVVVLGFWCGTFLSYTSITGFLANGWQGWAFAGFAVMLATAFVYPLFGKPSYYCANVCPFGGMQQLAGSMLRFKIKMSTKTIRRLDIGRQVLWALLMLFIWSGVWSSWIDYEPFTAFLLDTASWAAIIIAVAFVAMSFVITRPYCRFVCPMGTLLKYSQIK